MPDEKILSGLKEFTREYHATHPEIDFFIYGHVHILSREEISQGCEMVVLGEWIHTFSYAIFAENELKLSKWG